MDRKVIPYILVLVVFTIALGVLISTDIVDHKAKGTDYADELSENGGWISTSGYYIYVNSNYYVAKGTDVTQDDLGIWVHTEQNGNPVHHLFRWDDITAIMIDEEGKGI